MNQSFDLDDYDKSQSSDNNENPENIQQDDGDSSEQKEVLQKEEKELQQSKEENADAKSNKESDSKQTASIPSPAPPTAPIATTPDNNQQKQIQYAIEDNIPVSEYDKIKEPAMKFPFELDVFQKRGIIRVENHENVLVCAHTSSGKTVVAEYAISKAKALGRRIIYTSPIKALSNQKYRDFKKQFEDVGVVTGDVSINSDAQCLIMTTEILQNMLYKDSPKLKTVEYIIFDEVHYINDLERGHVWEEILILLPPQVGLVMLSATIPNYFEFAQWIGSIKKSTVYVEITYKRVVPLEHYLYVNPKKVFVFKTPDDKIQENNVRDAIKASEEENNKFFKNRSKPQGKKERKEREDKLSHQIKAYSEFLMKRQRDKFNEEEKQNYNRITQSHLKIEEIVTYITKKDLTPCVLFTFSIKKIDEYAKMLSNTQFITKGESNKIINFFDRCINKLCPEDRKIGQIQTMRKMLPSGIGVHHAGLLPVLKEIVEILYSRGLIKILFATTSFSIGLNMPTRTVVFTDITKFSNEGKKEILSSSEYLQMCGRAGRRGADDKGYVYILLGDKKSAFNPDQLVIMARGTGTSVESRFRLSYKTIINFFYRNIKDIVSFFKESYVEHNTFITMPDTIKKIEKLEKQIAAEPKIACMFDVESIGDYHEAITKLEKNRTRLYSQSKILGLLNPGRLLLYHSKKSKKDFYVSLIKRYSEYDGEIWCLKVDDDKKVVIEYESKGKPKDQFSLSGISNGKYYLYFVADPEDIVEIMDYTIGKASKVLLDKDDEGFDFYKKADLELILTELNNKNKEKLNPVNYLKVCQNEIDTYNILKEKEALTEKVIMNKCSTCNLLDEHLKQYSSTKKLRDELEASKKKISEEQIRCFNEFSSRLKILQKLSYIDKDNNLLPKGKAAREITSADCLLVTEVLMSNIISDLEIDELIAFLSCFVSNKSDTSFIPDISENFKKASEELIKINKHIAEVEKGENFEENKYNRKFSFDISEPIQEWMKGKHFYEILDDCDLDEGKVFTLINRLNLFIDSICEFYKALGNTTLGEKFVKAREVLMREIMTFRSLYLEDDLDIDNI